MREWQAIETIPLHTKIEIKTVTGMERIAVCYGVWGKNNRGRCFSKDRKSTGDLAAVAWRALPIE